MKLPGNFWTDIAIALSTGVLLLFLSQWWQKSHLEELLDTVEEKRMVKDMAKKEQKNVHY
jgi:hypothetical protein